jgi:hypothetical protein
MSRINTAEVGKKVSQPGFRRQAGSTGDDGAVAFPEAGERSAASFWRRFSN